MGANRLVLSFAMLRPKVAAVAIPLFWP